MKCSKKELRKLISEALENPCWSGYDMIGMKDKNGKKVPNCVKEDEENEEVLEEAEYQGRTVTLNKPTRSEKPDKTHKVYVKNDKGNVVVVHFGDANMKNKSYDPKRKKAFRSRHGCDKDPGPKWKARYWACKNW